MPEINFGALIDKKMAEVGFDPISGKKIDDIKPVDAPVVKPDETPAEEAPGKVDDTPVVTEEPSGSEGKESADDELTVEVEDLKSGTDDMPLEKRKKLMQADYTKKTQAVSKQRKENDALREKLDAGIRRVEQMQMELRERMQAAGQLALAPEPVKSQEDEDRELLSSFGLQFDELDSPNVVKAVTAMAKRMRSLEGGQQQIAHSMTAKEQLGVVNQLMAHYDQLKEKYSLAPEDEEQVIGIWTQMKKRSPAIPMEDAVKALLGRRKPEDMVVAVKGDSGTWAKIKAEVLAELKAEKAAQPTIPSSRASATAPSAKPAEKARPPRNLDEAMERAIAAEREGKLKSQIQRR